ncbi:PREDICTED: cold-regulated [Prunus dulcis]|uniref:PREDICTED: cold-regulated n=1 Tax=Prunus dulcis TaxID=3755 RepID=A0A5E4EHB4_PRUDU|nr:PREDICTED: cold-regulated [Prunus dulcis]
MAKQSYLKMMTESDANELIHSDLKDLATAAKKLANHAINLGSVGFGTSLLKWVAAFAAIYLLILDRTNWKSNILTGLLIPYIFFTLPSILFNIFRLFSILCIISCIFPMICSFFSLPLNSSKWLISQGTDWTMDCFSCCHLTDFLS